MLLVVAVLLAACGSGSSDALGAGAEVDACAGYEAYDELPEPDVAVADDVLSWATGFLRVMDRVDTDEKILDLEDERRDVPADVAAAFDVLERSVRAMRDRVEAAAGGGAAAVREAADSLAVDRDFASADARLREFHTKVCA